MFDRQYSLERTITLPPKPVVVPFDELFFGTPPQDYMRCLLSGETGSGKTGTIMTMPRPHIALIAERLAGDVDLRGLPNLKPVYLSRDKTSDDILRMLERIDSGDLKHYGIQSISLDSFTFVQKWIKGKIARGNAWSNTGASATGNPRASIKQTGQIYDAMSTIIAALFSMQCHILVTCQLRRNSTKILVDGKEYEQVTYAPDILPGIAKDIQQEATLVGYTNRKRQEGKADKFRTYFCTEMESSGRRINFECAKSPANWGIMETDASLWLKEIQAAQNFKAAA